MPSLRYPWLLSWRFESARSLLLQDVELARGWLRCSTRYIRRALLSSRIGYADVGALWLLETLVY